MKIKFIIVLFLFSIKAQGQFGNEWIDSQQELFKIRILEKGIYRIYREDLQKIGFPLKSAVLSNLKMFHHGKEIPILIIDNNDGLFDNQDYIEFYAEGNNGEQDSLLYRPTNARMNPYHSLYSDETNYFLTFGPDSKRTQTVGSKVFKEELKEPFHLEQQIKAFNEQYSFNNSIGYPPFVMQSYFEEGEGWSGKIIVADSLAHFPIKLENYLPQQNLPPILECLFNGRTEIVHDIRISLQNNKSQFRTIGQIDYFGFSPLKIKTQINPVEISTDTVIHLRSQSLKKENVEWHSITYHKITYPQSFDMLNKQSKYFYLASGNAPERHISILNAPAGALLYEVLDRYNYRKINVSVNDGKLNFVLDNRASASSVFVSNDIKKPLSIEKVATDLSYTKPANYLIITHKSLMQSATEFANYRKSEIGGGYLTNVIDIQDLYLNFSYGERTPLAIRRFIDFQLSKGVKVDNLLLIGRGRSFPDALKSDVVADMVPTMGYPGSDILLTAGLNNFDIDVQAVPTGRLNVSSNQEVLNYLQKLKDYESNTTDILWKKNVLHLNGGLSNTEINYFKDFLKLIVPKVQNGLLAGRVEAYSKKTNNSVENIDISEQLNAGVGMVTFIGHASATTTDLNIGFASSLNNRLQNKNKYPLMFFNGCGVGNVFNKYELLTTDWLLTPEKGAIVILANSFWSYDFPTSRYLNNLYEKLFEDSAFAGETIGKIQQSVNSKIKSEGADLFMLSNIHQQLLQGDPAVKIFPLKYPDYQLEKAFIQSKNQSLSIAANDSILLGIVVLNLGKFSGNTRIPLIIKTTNAGKSNEMKLMINNIAYKDTLFVLLKKEITLTAIDIKLDPENIIIENNETNNDKMLNIDWSKANVQTVYPFDALPDRLNPTLDVKFDDKKIKQGQYVASNATIKITLSDENPLSISDSTAVRLYVQTCETCSYIPVNTKNLKFIQTAFNQMEVQYILPNLNSGQYKLLVDGRDLQGNKAGNPYEIAFKIADKQSATLLLVYPNPAEDFCDFQFQVINTTKPISGNIKIFDSKSRLIQEAEFSPIVGQNDVFLNLKHFPTGIYFYRAFIEWGSGKIEYFEGKIVVQ
ncbi:MAG: C25 family cysteine peptidase [Emticicia sp.]|uniref:putative type IX secretion system sortase PorU2 n=1 Tax=Emticicia sp. TaxID=1930953 RepID=UPI003BA583F5